MFTYAVVVNYLSNDSDLARERARLEEDNCKRGQWADIVGAELVLTSSNLDKSFECGVL